MSLITHSKFVDCTNKGALPLELYLEKNGSECIPGKVYFKASHTKHVVVIGGGASKSCCDYSLKDSNSIVDVILSLGYQTTYISMGKDIATVLQALNPDIVHCMYYGKYGEDGSLAGLLNILDIPYTRSGLLSQAIGLNKELQYGIFIANGILAPRTKIVNESDHLVDDPMPRPYVIKPIENDFSFGVKVVFEGDDFCFKDYKFKYGSSIIVSQFIKGKELDAAVLDGKALGSVLEVKLLKGKSFFDEDAKKNKLYEHVIPASIPESIRKEILNTSERLWDLFHCNGLIRCEFIYNEEENKCYILEVNPMAGLGPDSAAPDIAKHSGISFKKLMQKVLDSATIVQ